MAGLGTSCHRHSLPSVSFQNLYIMNANIKKLNIESLLFFDIETVRASEELKINTQEYDIYSWKMRDRETDEEMESQELIKHYAQKAALYPTFNKVVCITLGFVIDNKMVIMSITGKEEDVIREFLAIYTKKRPILCGWNIIGFDLPVLRVAAFGAGLKDWPLGKANDSGNKPWTLAEHVVDLMEVYKGTYYYNTSLAEACHKQKVPSPKNDLNGSKVSEEYYKNGVEKISEYCKGDVIACIQLLRRMKGEDLYTEVVYRDDVVLEDQTTLEKVFTNGELLGEDKERFQKLADEKGLDKGKSGEILTALVGDKKSSVEL